MPYQVEDAAGRSEAGATQDSAGSKSVFENGVTQAAALIGVFGGILGVLYAIGGAVMWLRFEHVGIPADQAVPLVPKADLLVIGLRVMVLPALATAAMLIALASVRRGRALEFERLMNERTKLQLAPIADAGDEAQQRIAEIDARLTQLRERPRPLDALPRPLRRPARIALLVVVAFSALVVPFSFGAFAWPVALVGLVLYWLRLRRRAPIGSGNKFPVWRIAVAGVLAAALISVARQTDPPTQLPSVQAYVTDLPGLNRTLGLATPPTRAAQPIELAGVLITANGSDLSVGDLTRGRIITVPRSHVSSMVIGPPLDVRAPPESLLSRIIPGGTSWAVTPLEVWCVQLRYGWSQILDACEGGARILPVPDKLKLKQGTVQGIEVECPRAASDLCRGYVALQALRTGASDEPPTTTPVGYAVEPGAKDEIPVQVGAWFDRHHEPNPAGRIHARVRLLLTLTPKLDGVIFTSEEELVGKAQATTRSGGDDPKPGEPKPGDPNNTGDPNAPVPGTGDSGSGDPNSGDPNSPNPGPGDPGAGDPGTGDPGAGDRESEPPPLSYGPVPPPSTGTEPIGAGLTAG